MPKVIIFDWDGTLAHTRQAVVGAMEYVLKKHNKEPWDITKSKYRDTKKSLKDNFENFFGDNARKAYEEYLEYYQTNSYSKIRPLENAREFLNLCRQKNIDLCIISNKEKELLVKEVKQCFPDIPFKKILANGEAAHNKPFPDPVFKLLKNSSFEINRDNVWLVGDTKQDTECAYNSGVFPILIGKGKFMEDNYIKEKLNSSEPMLIFDTFREFIDFMDKG